MIYNNFNHINDSFPDEHTIAANYMMGFVQMMKQILVQMMQYSLFTSCSICSLAAMLNHAESTRLNFNGYDIE